MDSDSTSRKNQSYGLLTKEAGSGAVYEGQAPQAEYVEATATTYVVYRGDSADPYATAYDHETNSFVESTQIGENPLPDDDNHGVPSVVIDEDGYLIVFYGSHGSPHQIARSSNPYDISAWDDLGEMDQVPVGTYPHPVLYEGDIYVLYRTSPSWSDPEYPSAQYATIVRSPDSGESFEDLGPIVDSSGHPDDVSVTYPMSFSEHDDRFHISWFVVQDHATPVTATSQHRSGIYHATYDPAETAIYGLDGTQFEVPVTWEEYDDSILEVLGKQDVNAPKHVHLDAGPAILYRHYDPATINFEDGTSRIEWLVTFWRDGWQTERIPDTFATHLFDGGYPRINENGQLEVHIVTGGDEHRLVDGNRGGNFEVFTYDDGEWKRNTVAEADSLGTPISRVTTVKNGRDSFASLFQPTGDHPEDFAIPLFAYGADWDDSTE